MKVSFRELVINPVRSQTDSVGMAYCVMTPGSHIGIENTGDELYGTELLYRLGQIAAEYFHGNEAIRPRAPNRVPKFQTPGSIKSIVGSPRSHGQRGQIHTAWYTCDDINVPADQWPNEDVSSPWQFLLDPRNPSRGP